MTRKPILIIEDEHDLRETLKDLLELEGFETITAANGQEGLGRLCEMEGCGLILLDLMMPVMNGWEFLEIVRNRDRHRFGDIPIVVVSAAADAAQEVCQYGCPVMKKPVNIAPLIALARWHCQGRE